MKSQSQVVANIKRESLFETSPLSPSHHRNQNIWIEKQILFLINVRTTQCNTHVQHWRSRKTTAWPRSIIHGVRTYCSWYCIIDIKSNWKCHTNKKSSDQCPGARHLMAHQIMKSCHTYDLKVNMLLHLTALNYGLTQHPSSWGQNGSCSIYC